MSSVFAGRDPRSNSDVGVTTQRNTGGISKQRGHEMSDQNPSWLVIGGLAAYLVCWRLLSWESLSTSIRWHVPKLKGHISLDSRWHTWNPKIDRTTKLWGQAGGIFFRRSKVETCWNTQIVSNLLLPQTHMVTIWWTTPTKTLETIERKSEPSTEQLETTDAVWRTSIQHASRCQAGRQLIFHRTGGSYHEVEGVLIDQWSRTCRMHCGSLWYIQSKIILVPCWDI